jgi:uncharacterized Fe-S cluster-containing protein
MCRESQNAIKRRKWRYGSVYVYRPYSNLVKRLAKELGLTEGEVRKQIQKERAWLMGNPWYS